MLRNRLRTGVGVDYEHAYVADARRRGGASRLHFVTGDASCLPIRPQFDLAVCMTNTWGTMNDQRGILNEMRRFVPQPRMRLLSVLLKPPLRRDANGTVGWGTRSCRSRPSI
jgi:ubiquinone/menaquinone biosynthesis C-methylase UbiE